MPAQRFYHSDLADKSVNFWTAPTKARRAVLGRDAKNGTDVRNPSVPYSKCYGMTMSDDYAILFVGANGCAPVIGFQGRLYGMTPLHVILTMLLVRIPVSRDKQDQRNQSGPIFDSVTTTCHPDNAPGQDPCPSRKNETLTSCQSLFSLTSIGGHRSLAQSFS